MPPWKDYPPSQTSCGVCGSYGAGSLQGSGVTGMSILATEPIVASIPEG